MANTTKVFIDTSGSTESQGPYWRYVAALVSQKVYDQAAFYTFNVTADRSSRAAILDIARNLGDGNKGTFTSAIACLAQDYDALVIVTDGEVKAEEVARCDRLLGGMPFKSVEVHFQSTGYAMNLSVSAPFTRSTPSCRIVIDGKEAASGNTKERINLAQFYNAPEAFLAALDTLRPLMTLQNAGRRNEQLRNDLLDLQKNLLGHIASKNDDSAFEALRTVLATDYDASVRLMQQLVSGADTTLGPRIADAMSALLRIADGTDFSFGNLAPSRITRAADVQGVSVADLPQEEHFQNLEFSCPISLDDDAPLCFIARGAPVLADLDKSNLEDLLTNPLLFLLDTALVTRLIGRIDHLVGLGATKALFARTDKLVSPMTRRPISSALTFGQDKTHIKATNVALADLFFGNKLVGLSELWLAVVYFVVKEIPYLAGETGFIKAFEMHLTHRMRTAKTNLTLSGLPIEPMLKAPVDIAVWYCTVSPFLTSTPNNRLRDFGPTGKYLLQLTSLLGYHYERANTLEWMSLYKAFGWMMNEEKTPGSQWRMKLRAQIQNTLTLADGRIIALDGPATDATRPTLPDFSVQRNGPRPLLVELLALQKLVDRTKKTNDVYIPRMLTCDPFPLYAWNYAYVEGIPPDTFAPELGPTTFRPVVMDRAQRKHWKECSVQRYGDLKRQISLYNYFIGFVDERDCYPDSVDVFIAFLAQKQAARQDGGAMDTLPEHICVFVQQLFANYETVLGTGFANVPVAAFKKATWASMREVSRKQLDGSESVS